MIYKTFSFEAKLKVFPNWRKYKWKPSVFKIKQNGSITKQKQKEIQGPVVWILVRIKPGLFQDSEGTVHNAEINATSYESHGDFHWEKTKYIVFTRIVSAFLKMENVEIFIYVVSALCQFIS